MSLIEVRNLYKIFGGRSKKAKELLKEGFSKEEIRIKTGQSVALQNVSFSIEVGETFVIMGLSGSGKSTFVRCLNRLIEPTSGEILVDGQNVLELDDEALRSLRRQKMSMVFQRFGLFPHRTVLENVAYGLQVQKVPKEEREARANAWLQTVGLHGWEDSYASELSGGMQQRVGLARALCNDPEILLMDEPFSALDPLIRREMQEELIELEGQIQKTIVFITHDLDEALRLGDRIAIMKDGRVVQIGTPEEILTHPADDYVMDFTRDVNRLRVLSAQSVMVKPLALMSARGGPRVALRHMEEQGISSIFVVDRNQRLQGLLTLEDAIEASEQGVKDVVQLVNSDFNQTLPDTPLEELLPVAAVSKWPIAVVSDNGSLQGIIPRAAVLAALVGTNHNGNVEAYQKEIQAS